MWTTMDSPLGELRIVANQRALIAIDFAGALPDGSSPTSSAGVPGFALESSSERRATAVASGRPLGERDDASGLLRDAVAQLREYFDGQLKEFDLPLEPDGTAFQLAVWEQLRGIGYGATASYGEIARRLGMTNAASRAVGLANGRNPIPIVIPCHRVVGADGALTGYAGGVRRKQILLDLEQGALF